jgi:hypothetical protein
MVRAHQQGQAAFRSILPEDIDWKPFPAFPPSVRLAVLVGHASEPGPYVIRVKVPVWDGPTLRQNAVETPGGSTRAYSTCMFGSA